MSDCMTRRAHTHVIFFNAMLDRADRRLLVLGNSTGKDLRCSTHDYGHRPTRQYLATGAFGGKPANQNTSSVCFLYLFGLCHLRAPAQSSHVVLILFCYKPAPAFPVRWTSSRSAVSFGALSSLPSSSSFKLSVHSVFLF